MRLRPVLDPASGQRYLPVKERGRQLLSDSLLNKGTAFTLEEREAFGLRGLLPPQPSTLEEQLARVRSQWDAKPTPVEKHIFLAGLLNRNETLFHRFVVENLQETVPVVYTPTVAEACRHWSRMNRHARGIYVTPADRGQIARVLRNRGIDEAAVVVVTSAVVVVASAVVVVSAAVVVVSASSSPQATTTSENTASRATTTSQGRRRVIFRLLPRFHVAGAPPRGFPPTSAYPNRPTRAGHQ